MLVYLHIVCAFLSLGLLIIRGGMQLSGKDWRAIKLLKILPHLVDTLLIASGLSMFFLLKTFSLFFSQRACHLLSIAFTSIIVFASVRFASFVSIQSGFVKRLFRRRKIL